MAILLSVVFVLLVYPIHVAGLTLCDTDGTLEVGEYTGNNVFTCTGADSNDVITWTFQPNNENTDLATCTPASCNNPYKPQFEASRPADDRSTLTVNGSTTSYLQYIQGKTIVCKANPLAGNPGSPRQTQCTVDIVTVPFVTCDAHYNTGTSSPWTVTVNCSVSGAYSYLNRYTCNLIQTSPTTNSLGSGSLTVTSTSGSGGKYKTGYCQVTVPYPDVTGVYSYKMAVTPGRQDVPASFGGQSSLRIKRPSTPPSHNCPQYVRESQGTNCTCTATDLGQPAGVVRWTSTMTNQLSLSNVDVCENGNTYLCEVIWNGQKTNSLTYSPQVTRQTPSTAASDSISTGAAVGVGVGVAVMVLVDVIVIVWLWRREWVLPCADVNRLYKDGEMEQGGRPDTQQQQDQPPQFNDQRSQRDTGVYELQDTGEPNTPNVIDPYTTPSDYDLPQTSDMGQRSVYTSLSSPDYNAGAAGDTGPSELNNSETGPVYVNKDNSMTDPVYVNKDNSKTGHEYVNKDN